MVEWSAPKQMPVHEYVVEWVSGGWLDWQRENKSTRRTAIKGKNQERLISERSKEICTGSHSTKEIFHKLLQMHIVVY